MTEGQQRAVRYLRERFNAFIPSLEQPLADGGDTFYVECRESQGGPFEASWTIYPDGGIRPHGDDIGYSKFFPPRERFPLPTDLDAQRARQETLDRYGR